jgi:hypothetical protein
MAVFGFSILPAIVFVKYWIQRLCRQSADVYQFYESQPPLQMVEERILWQLESVIDFSALSKIVVDPT